MTAGSVLALGAGQRCPLHPRPFVRVWTLYAEESFLREQMGWLLPNAARGEVQVKLNKTHTSKGYITGAPKTARAVRTVPILDEALFRDLGVYLRNHPHRDDLEAGMWPGKVPGHRKISYDYAFDPKGFYRYTFKPACDLVGLSGLHFHELRHTFATLALESGALDMHELSRAMGPASYAITDKVYAHLRPRDYSRHRAAFSAHIAAASTPPSPIVALGG
ncbi:tyrosine-type recombinase/integrase [Microbacterium telephonicum]|uniref:tyrosine-type recombinase/integrase n=1 Tax=Microbacterium telephonicum TaxID=1714841 RepID=UPI0013143860|nr:tyrosine-type recombinase/integrase [Microbacterium telephonicum]